MIVVGLTGSIGMGKSTVGRMFAEEGAPLFESDAAVHALYAKEGRAVAPVEAAFRGVVSDGAIDRDALSARVVNDPEGLARLEAIVHPLVEGEKQRFLAEQRASGAELVVLDIPLLFEAGGGASVDKIVVVSAPADVQRARVLGRTGMSEEKFAHLLARQMPDAEKRARADFVIDTSGPLEATRAQVRRVLDVLREAR